MSEPSKEQIRGVLDAVERSFWSTDILEAYDAAETAYREASEGGAPADVVAHLQRAMNELFQARVKAGV